MHKTNHQQQKLDRPSRHDTTSYPVHIMQKTKIQEPLLVLTGSGNVQSEGDDVTSNTSKESEDVYGNTTLGMFLVAVATFFFGTIGAIIQAYDGSITQLMLGRYIFQHLISWIFWIWFKKFSNSKSRIIDSICPCPKWMTQSFININNNADDINTNNSELLWYGNKEHRQSIWIRGILYWLVIFCWFRSLEMVSIGDAEAILFMSPIVTTIIARCWLKEPLAKSFIVTLILALTSIIFITQPEAIFGIDYSDGEKQNMPLIGVIYLLISLISLSMQSIMVRKAKKAHWLQLELVATFGCAFIYTPLLIIICVISDAVDTNNNFSITDYVLSGGKWTWDFETFFVCIITAIIGFCGLMCVVIGYQLGNATKVSYMMYLNLVVAFGYQIICFESYPNIYTIIGVCLLVLSCLIHVIEQCYSSNSK